MPRKDEKIQITKLLESIFSKDDNISFYFLKRSKVTPESENKIPFKTKKKASAEKVKTIEMKFQKESGVNWEFIQWSQFIGKIIPESKVYKIPFFDSQNVEIKNPWRVCPIGEHWVRRHPKHLNSGKVTDHDGHCRKNPSKKDLLKGDEMNLISTSQLFLKPKVKVSNISLQIKMVTLKDQNQYDDLISGWTAYWNNIFMLPNPLHPNHVKALLATESKFIKTAIGKNKNPKIGPARGLMQITEATARRMRDGREKDYRDQFLELSYEELWEPNKNICAGIRQIFRKRETAKAVLKREPTWFEVMMDYKGWLKGNSKHANTDKEELKKYFLLMGMEIQ